MASTDERLSRLETRVAVSEKSISSIETAFLGLESDVKNEVTSIKDDLEDVKHELNEWAVKHEELKGQLNTQIAEMKIIIIQAVQKGNEEILRRISAINMNKPQWIMSIAAVVSVVFGVVMAVINLPHHP